MTDPITPSQFHEAKDVEDWRLTSEGATAAPFRRGYRNLNGSAFFRTRSFAESARFVQAISELPGVEEHRPAANLVDQCRTQDPEPSHGLAQ